MKQLETVGWLYTHVQSGDQELSTDEDYKDAADIERDYWNKQEVVLKSAVIAAIEAQGVPDGYAGAAAFTNVMPTVAIHFSATEQALSFLDKIRASWDRQQRSIASAQPALRAKPQPLSDEQLKQLLAAEYNRGWADCEATHDGP